MHMPEPTTSPKPIRSILVANRSEISIRVMRAAAEMGIRTVAVYSTEDRFALHRFKADESYLVGEGKKPIAAYLDIDDIIRIARETAVDAIHPGYGFLSENPVFAEACERAGLVFIGPRPEVMRTLGNKVAARKLAMSADVPVMPATDALPQELAQAQQRGAAGGYPPMAQGSSGGAGPGKPLGSCTHVVVAAGARAVPLVQVHLVAVQVAEHLPLEVPRPAH